MNRILKWFAEEGEDSITARLGWFVETIPASGFVGIDRMLYFFLVYCDKLGIEAKKEYLESFLCTEGKQVIKKENVRVEAVAAYDYNEPGALEEAYRVIASAALTRYGRCMELNLMGRAFKADMFSFMESMKGAELQNLLANAFPRISSGDSKDEIIESMQSRLMEIEESYSAEKLADLDFLEGRAYARGEKDRKTFLFKTGIPCIDGDTGGMYTKQCWTFTGAPGSGKTRFALAHFVYPAAVVNKLDVLVDELELSKGEVEDILIAYHIVNLYKGRIKIPDKVMQKNMLSDQQRRIYEAARMDLFESGKYGKIDIDCRGLDVETLKKKRMRYFKARPNARMWVIDYLGLLTSSPKDKYARHKVKYEIITDGIEKIKKIANLADIGALCLCQFSDEGVKASMAGKTITAGMVEGGHIIQRHSDYDIAMTMTEEQELARMRMLSTVKKRAATGFRNTPMRTDLAVSLFTQVSNVKGD